jgi:hypothetical protein
MEEREPKSDYLILEKDLTDGESKEGESFANSFILLVPKKKITNVSVNSSLQDLFVPGDKYKWFKIPYDDQGLLIRVGRELVEHYDGVSEDLQDGDGSESAHLN